MYEIVVFKGDEERLSIEPEKVHIICRCCVHKEGKINIFETEYHGTLFSTILSMFSVFEVIEEDGLPQKICEHCADFLANFCDFRDQLLESCAVLKIILDKTDTPQEMYKELNKNVVNINKNTYCSSIHSISSYSNNTTEVAEGSSKCNSSLKKTIPASINAQDLSIAENVQCQLDFQKDKYSSVGVLDNDHRSEEYITSNNDDQDISCNNVEYLAKGIKGEENNQDYIEEISSSSDVIKLNKENITSNRIFVKDTSPCNDLENDHKGKEFIKSKNECNKNISNISSCNEELDLEGEEHVKHTNDFDKNMPCDDVQDCSEDDKGSERQQNKKDTASGNKELDLKNNHQTEKHDRHFNDYNKDLSVQVHSDDDKEDENTKCNKNYDKKLTCNVYKRCESIKSSDGDKYSQSDNLNLFTKNEDKIATLDHNETFLEDGQIDESLRDIVIKQDDYDENRTNQDKNTGKFDQHNTMIKNEINSESEHVRNGTSLHNQDFLSKNFMNSNELIENVHSLKQEQELILQDIKRRIPKIVLHRMEMSLNEQIKKKHYICPSCHIFYSNYKEYLSHKKFKCKTTKSCNFCHKIFSHDTYKNHIKVHLKIHVCNMCQLSFSAKGDLRKHKATHKKIPFLCHICGDNFKNAKQLKDHKQTHLGTE